MKKKAAAHFVLSEHSSSPINIIGAPHHNAPTIQFHYPAEIMFDLTAANNVITALVSDSHQGLAAITINAKTYQFKQMHVHRPSEHTIDGERYAFEWHFVHQTDEGEYAVIGVFMEKNTITSAAYRPLFDALMVNSISVLLDTRRLIPNNLESWHYQGTLTTPPYDPVYWVVIKEIMTINESDDCALTKLIS